MKLVNDTFSIKLHPTGYLESLELVHDPYHMNWVISNQYLQKVKYFSKDKLFGKFYFVIENRKFSSENVEPTVEKINNCIYVTYKFDLVEVIQKFDLSENDRLKWSITMNNMKNVAFKIQQFNIWSAFSDVMFRDKHVSKNVFHSAAVFPSISRDFSKFAIMRRTDEEKSIGMYQIEGETQNIGSYCDFSNKFLEAQSPSLDGVLFYQLVLANQVREISEDWVYPTKEVVLSGSGTTTWTYVMCEVSNQQDFYEKGTSVGHPWFEYNPVAISGKVYQVNVNAGQIKSGIAYSKINDTIVEQKLKIESNNRIIGKFETLGEHVIEITLASDKKDKIVINVIKNLQEVINQRVQYLCKTSYQEKDSKHPFAFQPVSNQGESLGKLSLVLKKNLIGELDILEIKKVEKNLNEYVLNKWFINGDFHKPRKLYGSFYRVMDFEYLGHVLFLLSEFSSKDLTYHSAETYLNWAAEVVELRINPDWHEDLREKEESQMLGVFFLYINELINKLKIVDINKSINIEKLWENNLNKIIKEQNNYTAAITEHYYDNAGFAPAAAAIASSQFANQSTCYNHLLLANIGFSNDFRMQNPDRWWETLSYMIHALWGGISAAAAYDIFLSTVETEFLEASYRAFMAVFYCYDYHATAVQTIVKGEAISTFSCVKPNMNREDLSHKRFGQEAFSTDGGLFSAIFSDKIEQTSDWDMGEELVAYLDRFGESAYYYKEKNGKLKFINCHLETRNNQPVIVNDAPFPRYIYFIINKKRVIIEGDGITGVLKS